MTIGLNDLQTHIERRKGWAIAVYESVTLIYGNPSSVIDVDLAAYCQLYSQYIDTNRISKITHSDWTQSALQTVAYYAPSLGQYAQDKGANIINFQEEEQKDRAAFIALNNSAVRLIEKKATELATKAGDQTNARLNIIDAQFKLCEAQRSELHANPADLKAKVHEINALLTQAMQLIILSQGVSLDLIHQKDYTDRMQRIFDLKRALHSSLYGDMSKNISISLASLESYCIDRYCDIRGEQFHYFTYTRTQKITAAIACYDDIILTGVISKNSKNLGAAKNKRLKNRVENITALLTQTPKNLQDCATEHPKTPAREVFDSRAQKQVMIVDGRTNTTTTAYYNGEEGMSALQKFCRNH